MFVIQIYLFYRANIVVGVSKTITKAINRYFVHAETIYNGVDVPTESLGGVVSNGAIFKCVTAAVFNERKNHKQELEGFKKVIKKNNRLELNLLGDGVLKDRYSQEYSEERIKFWGKISSVQDFLIKSNLYISASYSEGLPMAVLEAMAVNMPVLLSDIPQHRELSLNTKNEGIEFFELDNIDDFISKLIMFSQKIESSAFFCNNRRLVREHFSSEVMTRQYENIYRG